MGSAANLIHVENHSFPYVGVNFAFQAGSVQDPPGKEGLAYLTLHMLSRGTRLFDREALADELDFIGTGINANASRENMNLFLDGAKRNLARLLELAGEMLAHPSFPQEELDKLIRQTVAETLEMKDNDAMACQLFFSQLLFEGHPYGKPIRGFASSLSSITREEVVAFHRDNFTRDKLVVGVAGAVPGPEAVRCTEAIAGLLPQGNAPLPPQEMTRSAGGHDLLLVTRPDRTQAQVLIGCHGVKGSDPDYIPLRVAVTGFGGTFTSLLVREIREKRGWSYSVGASITPGKHTGVFMIHFAPKNQDVAPAIKLALELLAELENNGLAHEHLDFARRYLVNQFPFMVDTPVKKLEVLLNILLTGRPPDYLDKYVEKVLEVDEEASWRSLRRLLGTGGMSIVVLGDESLSSALSTLPGVKSFRVIPYDWDGPLPDRSV